MGSVNSPKNEVGSVLVESAISIPVLLLILFGIIQYGLIISAEVTLRNAASVGAREAALLNRDCSDIENAIQAAVTQMLPASGIATYPKNKISVNGQDAFQVGVTYNLPLILPFVVPGSGGTRTITANAIMRPQQPSVCSELQ